jgi:hypothetical protein
VASKTEVFNRALIKIGVNNVSSPDDPSEQARKCSVVFPSLVRAELRKNPWSFAIARVALPVLATAPAFGWSFAYQKPSDFVRVVQVGDYYDFAQIRVAIDQPTVPYALEGQTIVTDLGAPLRLRYVRNVSEDTESWDDLFTEAFACRLAMEVCESLTKNQSKFANVTRWYKESIAEAKRLNAIELPPVPLPDNSWVTTRI